MLNKDIYSRSSHNMLVSVRFVDLFSNTVPTLKSFHKVTGTHKHDLKLEPQYI